MESDLSDDREQVLQIRGDDKGSLPHCIKVEVQGVPMYGIVDSGANITIIGGQMFKKVATVTKLKRRDFKVAYKQLRNYDQKPFELHGGHHLQRQSDEESGVHINRC